MVIPGKPLQVNNLGLKNPQGINEPLLIYMYIYIYTYLPYSDIVPLIVACFGYFLIIMYNQARIKLVVYYLNLLSHLPL